MDTPEAPEKITLERDYPGEASQAMRVRADLAEVASGCPAADDLILLASELAANATTHSKSGKPGGRFTVRVNLYPGDYAWAEIIDQGGPWTPPAPGKEPGCGPKTPRARPGDRGRHRRRRQLGIDGGTSCHVVWFRLNWHQDQPS